MTVAQYAENILSAWTVADHPRFEAEVASALLSCQTSDLDSGVEYERRQVLQGIAEHFERLRARQELVDCAVSSGLLLLHHLRNNPIRKSPAAGIGESKKARVRHETCDMNCRGQNESREARPTTNKGKI